MNIKKNFGKTFLSGSCIALGSSFLMSFPPGFKKDINWLYFLCFFVLVNAAGLIFMRNETRKRKFNSINYKGFRGAIGYAIDLNIFAYLFALPIIFFKHLQSEIFIYLGSIIGCIYALFANIYFRSFGFRLAGLDSFLNRPYIILLSNFINIALLMTCVLLIIRGLEIQGIFLGAIIGLDWTIQAITGRNILYNIFDIKYKKIID